MEGKRGFSLRARVIVVEPEQCMEWEVLHHVYDNLPKEIDSGDVTISQPSCCGGYNTLSVLRHLCNKMNI